MMRIIKKYAGILVVITALVFVSCSKDDAVTKSFGIKQYSFDSNANSTQMFQESELQEIMTSEARRFKLSQIIRVKAINSNTIEVANFAPVALEDLTIIATIAGIGKIKLFRINKIRAHARQELKYSFFEEESRFYSVDGGVVDLKRFRSIGIHPNDISFNYEGSSDLVSKLKTLSRLNWELKFHDFDVQNSTADNWASNIAAKDIRRYTAFMINMGYIIASKSFEEDFLKEHLVKNDGITVLTLDEKVTIYNRMITKGYLKCGKVEKVSGFGDESTFGISESVLNNFITKSTGFDTAFVFGHCLGYDTNSNMTLPIKLDEESVGLSEVLDRATEDYLTKNEFPISWRNYYKTGDF